MTIEQLTYNGDNSTMVCLVDDEMLRKYRQHADGITPSHVVDSFDIFKFESGKQGTMLRPSKTELESIFGTTDKEKAIEFMLQNGTMPVHHTKTKKEGSDTHVDGNSRVQVDRRGRPV